MARGRRNTNTPPAQVTMTTVELEEMIAQRVAEALVTAELNRTPQNSSGGGSNSATRCSYKDFLNCKPLTFAGTEGPVGLIHWCEKAESVFHISNCADQDRVKYATGTLQGSALTWWNTYSSTVGKEAAFAISWENLKKMMTEEYCTRAQVQEMEVEFWELKCKGTDISSYNTRFQELALMCPTFVTPEYKRVERYIWGLPSRIQDVVSTMKGKTIGEIMLFARELMLQAVRQGNMTEQTENRLQSNKRKWDSAQGKNAVQGTNQRQAIEGSNPKDQIGKKSYAGKHPWCHRCERHHSDVCSVKCTSCNKLGHLAKNCRGSVPATASNRIPVGNCFECGEAGHFRNACPKKRLQLEPARGRAYIMTAEERADDIRHNHS